jgi:DNA-binding NarL/FixJ family response regulator
MKDVIKTVHVDDHTMIRSGVAQLLESQSIEIVFGAINGLDMIDKLKVLKKDRFPDVFIIDINMPNMGGFETIEWLHQNYPHSKIIVLTMYDKPEFVMQAIRLGVKSYITKEQPSEELIKAIKAVYENKLYFTEGITQIIVEAHKNFNKQGYNENTALHSLSEREKQILRLMCTEMTHSEIAKELGISTRTIDKHRDNLYKKLNVKSRVGLAMIAIKE